MDNFDKVYSYLTEEEGLSPEDASRAMVMMVEQGFDPTQVFLGGLAKLLDFLPKKKVNPVDAAAKQPPAPKPAWSSVGTTKVNPQQGPALSTRVAPAPQWGGSPQAQDIKRLNQLTKGPIGDKTIQKPVVSSGRMGKPQGPALSTNVAPKPRFATSLTPAPKPAWNAALKATPKNLFGRLTNNRYVRLATSAVPFVLGADALIRGDQSVIGRQGRSGPELTPEIVKGVQQREKLAQQRAETQAASKPAPEPTGERSASANVAKQETAKANIERRRVAAASFDKEFAAARAAGKDVFTWRSKQYNTKLK